MIGQTIGEAIAGRLGGAGGTTTGQDGEGEHRGGFFSAIGDWLGFDGEFGYDGINGPTGAGRQLSLAVSLPKTSFPADSAISVVETAEDGT